MNENIVPSPHSQRTMPPRGLREDAGRTTVPWEEKSDPIIRFNLSNGKKVGHPFFGVVNIRVITDDLVLIMFQSGNVTIRGPKAAAFYDAFCAHRATNIRADGTQLVSVDEYEPPR